MTDKSPPLNLCGEIVTSWIPTHPADTEQRYSFIWNVISSHLMCETFHTPKGHLQQNTLFFFKCISHINSPAVSLAADGERRAFRGKIRERESNFWHAQWLFNHIKMPMRHKGCIKVWLFSGEMFSCINQPHTVFLCLSVVEFCFLFFYQIGLNWNTL